MMRAARRPVLRCCQIACHSCRKYRHSAGHDGESEASSGGLSRMFLFVVESLSCFDRDPRVLNDQFQCGQVQLSTLDGDAMMIFTVAGAVCLG